MHWLQATHQLMRWHNDTRRPLPADLRPARCAQEQRHLPRQRGAAVGEERHQSAERHGAAAEGHH